MPNAKIETLSHEGRGTASVIGKVTFIENALPGEEVEFNYTKRHGKFDEGVATKIITPSPDRVEPLCPHFNICGGCLLQHLESSKQLEFKTRVLHDHLKHFGDIQNAKILPPISGPIWGYRSRARLAVKYVQKKQSVLVGFHEKKGRYIAEITSCPILHPIIGTKISALRELIASLTVFEHIPQIEVACADNICALVFRNLKNFSESDLKILREFGDKQALQLYMQPGNNDSVCPIFTDQNYTPPRYTAFPNIEMFFSPTDFTQINREINKKLIAQVLSYLQIVTHENILDLFCGIGNFTLPLATKCNKIVGVEGSSSALTRAKQNAAYNKIENAEFFTADLTKDFFAFPWSRNHYDKILLDPPRTGALEICAHINKFNTKKIVYVSCNPATLARDAKELIMHGYKLTSAEIVDMFPHTSHMETIAVFDKKIFS